MSETPGTFDELEKDLPPEAVSEPVDRRAFIQAFVGIAGACYAGAIGYPVYRYLTTPARRAETATAVTQVELDVANLAAGSVLMFKFGTHPAMLIHHADGSWVCFDAVCTHLGCTVQFQPKEDRIFCACHGGTYDPRTGANVAGPPPKPLKVYKVEVTDGKALVSRG